MPIHLSPILEAMEPIRVKPLLNLYSYGRPINIIPEWKCIEVENTLAYDTATITAVKCVIVQASGLVK